MIMFLNYRAKCARARAFSRPFCRFSIFCIYCLFLGGGGEGALCSFTEMKADIVCTTAQAAILQSSGHSVKEFAKLLKKT